MRTKQIALLVVVIELLIGRAYAEEDTSALTKVGDAVPKFTLKTIDGQTLTPESLKGKVVLLNFFATWCGPCQEEMPELQKLHEKYKDANFLLVSVGREHSAAEVKAYVGQKTFTFAFAPDPTRETYKLFATQYIPRNYLIDPTGKIVYQSMGYDSAEFEKLKGAIEKTVKESK